MNMRKVRSLLLMSSVLLLVSCGGTVKINQILVDPSRYAKKDVEVEGDVVGSYSIIGHGAYQVRDDTGALWVVSDKGVPRKGSRVAVKGRVHPRKGSRVAVKGRVQDVVTIDVVQLPSQVGSGVVMIESSHKASR
jgi:hypothetical protein